uniref:WxxW domain-containing protein n=1 Tax=Poecilia mexicana TaxID=48701 RepID=A0A3B3XEF5_9TELE
LSSLRREDPGKICPQPDQYGGQDSVWAYAEDTGEKIYEYDTTSGYFCRKRDQRDRKLCWWYNRDCPSGSGDWEHLSALRKEKPGGDLCADLVYVEAFTVEDDIPFLISNQTYTLNRFCYHFRLQPWKRFVCQNKNHRSGKCRDYKVRFGCSCRSVA